MRRSRVFALIILLALCVLVFGGGFPTGPALAQEGSPAAQGVDQAQAEATAASFSPDAVQAVLGTAFTYQANLKKSGQPVNTTCSFQFSLWDAASGGSQKGTTQIVNNAQVQAGSFTVELDFGNQFTGDARWLQTALQRGEFVMPSVIGEIRKKWLALGGEKSFLGKPLTDEMKTPDGVGRFNRFHKVCHNAPGGGSSPTCQGL